MVMDGTVSNLGDGHCLSMTNDDSDLEWLRKIASDRSLDVEITERTAEMPHLQVQGPLAREVLGPITEGADVGALRYCRFLHEGVRVAGISVWLSRTGYSGELGFELYCAPEDARRCGTPCSSGPPHGLRPIGLSAIETLRIESGFFFPISTTSLTRPTRSRSGSTTSSSWTGPATSPAATRSARSPRRARRAC